MQKLLKNQLLAMEYQMEQMRMMMQNVKATLELIEQSEKEKQKKELKNQPCQHPKEARKPIETMGGSNSWICSVCNYIGEGVMNE